MPRKYKNYTDEDIRIAVETSVSIAQVLNKLGLKPCGGNYQNIQRKISKLGYDVSHFTGQLWHKDKFLKKIEDYAKPKVPKKMLISIRGHKCENCGNTEWSGQPIPLEIHHINGNRFDNREENLQILCPNCHAFTDNYRNRKT